MVIIGGLGSIYGSFLGAAILTFMPEILRVFNDFDIVIYGALLIVMTIFMPGGLASGFRYLTEKAAGYLKRKTKGETHAQA
jgi:branched-chain amino acid transport system permease protein